MKIEYKNPEPEPVKKITIEHSDIVKGETGYEYSCEIRNLEGLGPFNHRSVKRFTFTFRNRPWLDLDKDQGMINLILPQCFESLEIEFE
jgi:hypothetical protein